MDTSQKNPALRLEIMIAILIAVVSTTVALVTWRTTAVSSSAGEASRMGMLDTIKKQAFFNETWRQVYQEAGYAGTYAVYTAEIEALETSDDPTLASQAANLRLYMLPNLELLAGSLVTDSDFANPDGSYNLEKRFTSLESADLTMRNLDPQTSFQLADRYYSEQRWLTVTLVLLATSLFWLALAEIGGKRLRALTLILGGGVFGLALLHLAVVEVYFVLVAGGAA
jgi:hypothetical protein